MHTGDEPRSAPKPEREKTLDMRCSGGRLTKSLANGTKLGQPLRAASRRMREHTVAAIPEREAAVDRLLESH